MQSIKYTPKCESAAVLPGASHCHALLPRAYPIFNVGHVEVPAFILPVVIAAVFLASVYFGTWQQSPVAREDVAAFPNEKSEKEPIQVHDEENTAGTKAPPQRATKWAAGISHWLQLSCWIMINQDINQDGGHTQSWKLHGIALVEIALMLGPHIASSWRQTPRDQLVTSLGWIVLVFEECLTTKGTTANTWLLSSALVLAATNSTASWPDPSFLDTNYSTASISVVALAPFIAADSWILRPQILGSKLWPFMVLAGILTSRYGIHKWQTLNELSTRERLVSVIRSLVPTSLSSKDRFCIFLDVAIWGFLGIFIFVIGFLTSCLPFRKLIFDLPAEPPSLIGLSMAGGLLVFGFTPWVISRRKTRVTPADDYMTIIKRVCVIQTEAAGWSNVAIVVVAATIFAIKKVMAG